jgi:hypothetical protein
MLVTMFCILTVSGISSGGSGGIASNALVYVFDSGWFTVSSVTNVFLKTNIWISQSNSFLAVSNAHRALSNNFSLVWIDFLAISNAHRSLSNNFILTQIDFNSVSNAHRSLSNNVIAMQTALTVTSNAFVALSNNFVTLSNNFYNWSNSVTFVTNSWLGGPTGLVNLNNRYQLYTASGNTSITGMTNADGSQYRWMTLWITNSAAVSITNFMAAGNLLVGSTNALVIPSGKVGVISIGNYANMFTNVVTGVQQ